MAEEMTHWIPQADYDKAIFQLRGTINGIMLPFIEGTHYGLRDTALHAIDEIIKASEDFSLRVRGVDKPINIDYIRRRKPKKGGK